MTNDNHLETAKIVNLLFERMTYISPSFRQAWPTQREFEGAKLEWTKAFIQKGICKIEQVQRGLDHFRLHPSPFVPSPGQFLEMCKLNPADVGAPPLSVAYRQACLNSHPCQKEKKWDSDEVRYAFLKTTSWTLSTQPESISKPIFEAFYIEACQLKANGGSVKMLENTKDTPEMRVKYQEQWGSGESKMPYDEWLASGMPSPDGLERKQELSSEEKAIRHLNNLKAILGMPS